jgi:hypothetical protein
MADECFLLVGLSVLWDDGPRRRASPLRRPMQGQQEGVVIAIAVEPNGYADAGGDALTITALQRRIDFTSFAGSSDTSR